MFRKTLFFQILFPVILGAAIILGLFCILLGVENTLPKTSVALTMVMISLTAITAFGFYLKKILYPLHCLTQFCRKLSDGHQEHYSCYGSAEVMALSEALNELVQSKKALCEQKQDIFKEAAHELKSPIAILKARFALFGQDPHADKKEFVTKGKEDIENIIQKLKELLFLKEIEWEMQQKKERFYLKEQCDGMRMVFAPILEKKGLKIVTTSDEDFELYVHKDAISKVMQAVFENIFYHTKNHTTIQTTIDMKTRALKITNVIGDKSDESLFSTSIGTKMIQRLSGKLGYEYKAEEKGDFFVTTLLFS